MMYGLMIRVLTAVVVVGVALAVWADLAAACSCADQDERDRLEQGHRAVIGRVLEERALDDRRQRFAYRVRVERSVGVPLPREIEVFVDFTQCGTLQVGRRQGIFITRRGDAWRTNGCSIVSAAALERALRPYRRPTGSGRLALLAAGSFGNARLMALDTRGRVLGYGFGEGETRSISVCPGAARSAEVVMGRRSVRVAVRDLNTLGVARSVALPLRRNQLDTGRPFPLRCADADGAAVHVAVGDYIRRTQFDRMRIFRVDASGAHLTASLEGSTAAFGPGTAYVGRYGHAIIAVDLAGGATRRVTGARAAEPMSVSPDGARLAFYDSERLRVVDVVTGAERSRRVGYGQAIEWLDSDRLLFRSGSRAIVYDTRLQRLRRYRFVRFYGQAHLGGRVYGTSRYSLRALDLETGHKSGVASLTDRGILDLVEVPEQPLIEPGTRRPPGPARARGSSSSGRCFPPGTSAPAPDRRRG
jgi:hypothetical protein